MQLQPLFHIISCPFPHKLRGTCVLPQFKALENVFIPLASAAVATVVVLLFLLWSTYLFWKFFPAFSFTILFDSSSTDSVILSLWKDLFPTEKSYNSHPTHCFFRLFVCFCCFVSGPGKSFISGAKTFQGK